ncbi:PEP-CTERM sorting domain-containing protein [Armatimonas sp.]|uniref:PEP-CTERM sorting domain-containing protein n=1 Tax=Armatimonas sp. TaxID=1872638 RepID=UPI00286A8501|nr:PEP-CTERM sorting domain-containing protein [Armatimonas sp.]
MISRLVSRLSLTALMVTLSTLAHAQATVIYSTGFEAPTFSTTATATIPNFYTGAPFTTVPGALAASPADQWGLAWEDIPGNIPQSIINYEASVNSATVQSGVVRSGTQALKVDGAVANQRLSTAFKGLPLSTVNRVYDFNFDMRVSGASAQVGQWGVTIIDQNSARIASLGFYQGILVAGSGASLYGLGPFTPIGYDNWATYKLSVNFFTNTMSVALNGFPISSMQNLPLRNDITFTSTLAGVGLGGQAPDGAPYTTTPERAYFDSFSVTSAPEPGTLAFLVLGGMLVIARRRSAKKEG